MFNFFKKAPKKNTKEKTVETKKEVTNENEKNYNLLRSQVASAVSSVDNGAEKAYINSFTGFFIRKESGYAIYQEGIYQSTRSDKEAIIRFVVNRYPNRYAI